MFDAGLRAVSNLARTGAGRRVGAGRFVVGRAVVVRLTVRVRVTGVRVTGLRVTVRVTAGTGRRATVRVTVVVVTGAGRRVTDGVNVVVVTGVGRRVAVTTCAVGELGEAGRWTTVRDVTPACAECVEVAGLGVDIVLGAAASRRSVARRACVRVSCVVGTVVSGRREVAVPVATRDAGVTAPARCPVTT